MSESDRLRKYLNIINESIQEKWGVATKVSPREKGKYKGKTKTELQKQYNRLKARGPHKKGSPEYGKMRELAFAIRAKSGWGSIKEELDDQKISKAEAAYTDLADHCNICKNFISKNSCKVVKGNIKPDGWCKYFKNKFSG